MALDQASLVAHSSECLGIFGLSNAGKSVLLRMLAGTEASDEGTTSRAEAQAGIACQTPTIDGALTASEALWLYATLYEIPRRKRHAAVRDVLSLVGLDSQRDRRIGTLSWGAQKLLEVARVLMSPSNLLLLDEPMAGLDFDTRRHLWEHLLRTRTLDKKTIIVATSRAEDAELCDRVVLLHEGRVLATGTPAELRSMAGPEALVVTPAVTKGTRPSRTGWSGIVGREQDGHLVVEMEAGSRPSELLRQIPGDVAAVRLRPRRLDSVLDELLARPELLSVTDS